MTLKEIARQIGVSQGTVSRVLNGNGTLSAHTRERVRKALEELHYKPDLNARDLVKRRWSNKQNRPQQRNFAFIHGPQSAGQLGMAEYVLGLAQAYCGTQGHALSAFLIADENDLRRFIRIARARGIEGIVAGPYISNLLLDDPVFQEIPTISCSPEVRSKKIHQVLEDDYDRIQIAVTEAARRGYSRIGGAFISHGPTNHTDLRRSAALHSAEVMVQQTCSFIPPFLCPMGQAADFDLLRVKLSEWFHAHQPDCIIGLSAVFYHALVSGKIMVPERTAFIALTLKENEKAQNHMLSGFYRHRTKVTALAFRFLEQVLPGKDLLGESSVVISLQPTWHEGRTLPLKIL